MLELLEAQKVIEEVETEVGEYVPKEMIACLHSQNYDIVDPSSVDRQFITAISNIACNSAQHWLVSAYYFDSSYL